VPGQAQSRRNFSGAFEAAVCKKTVDVRLVTGCLMLDA
jgi:hypothetical protein